MKQLKIGNVILDNRIIVGPMAGISNNSFRTVIKEFGGALIYSEMISDKAICFKNKKTLKMCAVDKEEKPITLQLFGHDIDTMVKAAVYLDKETDCDIIDINMGCPVKKVCKSKAGSALMQMPEHAYEMVKAIVENVKKPVTVKLRAGWSHQQINVVEMAVLMEKAGVSAVAVHPRTRTDYYAGHSDWDLIRQVKEAVNVPVIGNGDVKTVQDYIEMRKLTNCDFVMVARGCLGNPWLIKQLVEYDKTGKIFQEPTYQEKIEQCLYHARELVKLKGEKNGIKQMRGHACWYISGLANANKVKAKINKINKYDDLNSLMEKYVSALNTEDYSYFEK
ncbi:MAG: tRNA dihydrouridine synthase DusB [Erysipelotrichaceae bacterium]|jgi:nifR3 family TIM-barrel protein